MHTSLPHAAALAALLALLASCDARAAEPAVDEELLAARIEAEVERRLELERANEPDPIPDFSEEPIDVVPSLEGTYSMRRVCDTQPELTIESVEVTEDRTHVEFVYRNAEAANSYKRIRVFPPGHLSAFFLRSADGPHTCELLGVEGITIAPQNVRVYGGESCRFRLAFDRLPDTMTRFHVVEGRIDSEEPDFTTWNFLDVELGEPDPAPAPDLAPAAEAGQDVTKPTSSS